MDSRLEKRIKSIRSLPHGQFNKYRQMFDSLMKTRCREKCKEVIRNNSSIKDANSNATDSSKPVEVSRLITTRRLDRDENNSHHHRSSETITTSSTIKKKESVTRRIRKKTNITDDEKTQHLRVDSSLIGFSGISDETNLLLNSLCATNQQIAEFFERTPTTISTLTSSQISNIDPIATLPAVVTASTSESSVLLSSSLASSSPLSSLSTSNHINNSNNSSSGNSDLETSSVYKAVPVSPIELVTHKQSATLYQPNDTIITYIIENDSVKEEEEESRVERRERLSSKTATKAEENNFFSSSMSSSSQSSTNMITNNSKKLSSLSPSSTTTSTTETTTSSSHRNREYHLFSSTISTVLTSNYLDLDDHDDCDYDDYDDDDDDDENDMDLLSDDSYDDDELVLEVDDRTLMQPVDDDDNWKLLSVDVCNNRSYDDRVAMMMNNLVGNDAAVSSSTSFSTPPPKPARTFEHDLYLSGKSNSARSSMDRRGDHSLDTRDLSSLSTETDSIPLRPSRCLEHIYETLPSVDQLSLQDNSNSNINSSSSRVIQSSEQINVVNEKENNSANNKGKVHFKKSFNFANFANLVVANKSEVDLKKLSNNNDKKDANKQSNLTKSKLAHSEPNLSEIGRGNNKKNQNVILKPFGRFLNTLKKTLSRKNVLNASTEDSASSSSSSSSSSCQLPSKELVSTNSHMYLKRNSTGESTNRNVEWRNRNNNNHRKDGSSLTSINEKFITKSYIYSDPSELNSFMSTLFDYVLIVGLQEHKTCSSDQLNLYEYFSKLTPIILWKYPEEIANMNTAIPEFCFPDPSSRTEYKKNDEIFQFTLTNIDASRTYGYCIRVCQKNKNPIVICIISQIDALEMYYTVLIEAAKLYQSNMNDLKLFLSAIFHKSFPNRGESLVVGFGDQNRKEIVLNRCIDRRLEHINLYTILNYPFDFVIDIFESFLTEKKIIFLSNKLSLLSSTIQAFETLLYPFNWPHTYIPVLPSYLIEMCDAPTPYIIGLMRSCKADLAKYRAGGDDGLNEDMLIVDLDKQRFIYDTAPAPSTRSSSQRILPESVLKALKIDLYNLVHNNSSSKFVTDLDKNVELCRIFLKVFVKTLGNYANFIVADKDNKDQFIFLEKEFVNEAKSPEIKKFLDYFTKTQLFEVFIVKKLTPGIRFGLMFDEAIRKEEFDSNRHSLVNVCSQKAITIRQLKNKDKTRKARF